ncbi:MAG: group I truncated hemoglobin [Propylenella sp.]
MKGFARKIAAALIAAPFAGALLIAPACFGPVSVAVAKDSLYKRLGGYDAIAAVTDDFVGRLLKDEMFARFFAGFSTDSKKRVRRELVDFVCEKTGGPCFYLGRDMKTVHEGIGITKAEWDRALVLFGETLKALNVPEAESQELAGLITPLEKDIVEKQ